MVELPANDTASVANDAHEPSAGRAIGRSPAVAYDAFISYSHAKDKGIATALQSVVQKLGKPWYRRRVLRVFRDDTSLSATPHLWPSIEQALSQSRFLILIASPEAAASRWIGQEIAYWLERNSSDTVLIALTDGELDWEEATRDFRWSEATPLPTALKNRFSDEPRWVDLRPYRGDSAPKSTEFMGLAADFAAAIRGIPKEDLLSQEVQQQRRALALAWMAATVLVALLVAAGWQWQEARLQRDKARMELLAMQARRATEGDTPDDIERGGALALESIEIARTSNEPVETEATEAAWSVLIRLPLGVLQQGSEALCLAVLPNGRLASGGEGGTIKIWPKEGTGEPKVLSHGGWVFSLAVLTDGRLASGGEGGTIKIWPKEGAGEPLVLQQGSTVFSFAALKDGRLASGDEDGRIKIWPKEGVGEPVVLRQGDPVLSLAALPDGRFASGVKYGGDIIIWPKDGAGEPIVLSHGGRVSSLAVSADGRLAAGYWDGNIKIWPKEGKGEPVLLSHGSFVHSLAVLADGRLASGGSDGKIKLWPKEGFEPMVFLQGSAVDALAVLEDGRLASGSQDGKIKLWPEEDTGQLPVLSHGGAMVDALAVLADGRLASGGADGKIRLWPKYGAGEPVVLPHGGDVTALAALADGRLASGGDDGKIKIWPKEGSGDPVVLSHGSRTVYSLAVLGDGRLASAGAGGNIKIWSLSCPPFQVAGA
jgi:WD40 repeat protein